MLKKIIVSLLLSLSILGVGVQAKPIDYNYEVSYPNGVTLEIESTLNLEQLNYRILDAQYEENDFIEITQNVDGEEKVFHKLVNIREGYYPVYVISADGSKNEYNLPLREISKIVEK